MTVISTKSITGVTSITSPQSDDAVTLHTNDTTQRVSVTTGGMNVTGVVTATSFSGNITGTASNASGATGDFSIADKIVHTGDTNTAIRFAGENIFTVETGGGERLRIVGVGSFGINNSDPKYTMHFKNAMSSSPSWIHMEVTGSNTEGGGGGIAFDTSASNSASNNSLFLATVSGERSGSNNGSNSLVFKTSKSGVAGDDGSTSSSPRTAMVINEDRNVGIGTTNADSLSGFTHSSGSTLVLNNLGSNSNWNGQIRLGNTGSGYLIDHNAGSTTTTTFRNIYGATNAAALTKIESGFITFHTGTSYAERLRIAADSNITQTIDTDGDGFIITAGSSNIKAMLTGNSNRSAENNTIFGISGKWNSTEVGRIAFEAGPDTTNKDDGDINLYTRVSGGSLTSRLNITSAGILQCGTSGTLKAEINNAVSGHQFISQCSDNNNGFEIYQQHGSTATRNTLAVYDNRGNSGAKQLSFAVIGDGNVSVPNGNLVMGNDCGIDFSAADDTASGESVTSSILDDYEEGTFTMHFNVESQGNMAMSGRFGVYTKVGRLVTIHGGGQVHGDPSGQASNIAIEFSNLPFTSMDSGVMNSPGITGSVNFNNLDDDASMSGTPPYTFHVQFFNNGTSGRIVARDSASTPVLCNASLFLKSTTQISVTITYMAAA